MCNVLRVSLQLPTLLRGRVGLAQAWRAQWRHALVVSTLGPLAYICVLYALTQAPLSHVAPARDLSMLVAALIGGKRLGERDRGLRLLGAGSIAAGVMALATGKDPTTEWAAEGAFLGGLAGLLIAYVK